MRKWLDFAVAVIIAVILILWMHVLTSAQGPVERDLGYLRAAVRYQIRAQTTSELVSDTLLDYAINRAISRVCSNYPALVKFDTVAIDKADEGGALNSDFDHIKAVYHMGGDTIRFPLKPVTPDSEAIASGTVDKSYQKDKNDLSSTQWYHVSGLRLFIQPKPSRPTTDPDSFFVEYYAQDAKLDSASDSTLIYYKFIDKVILYAATLVSGTRKNYGDAYLYWSLFRDDLSGYRAIEQAQAGQ